MLSNFLVKRFVKNSENVSDVKVRESYAKIETELESKPTDNLIKKRSELVIIPMIPARLA